MPAEGIHLTFGPDPASSMVVSWLTREPVDHPQVRYCPLAGPDGRDGPGHTGAPAGSAVPAAPADTGTTGSTDSADTADTAGTARPDGVTEIAEAVTRSYTDAVTGEELFAHHALLAPLEPDTRYRYEVRHGRTEPRGDGVFRTAPAGRAPFTFAFFGDHGTDSPDDPFGSPASGMVVGSIEQVDPLFTIVAGDLAYSNIRDNPPRAWRDWFRMIHPSAGRRPWMPLVGNHEIERGNGALGLAAYQTYFELPDNDAEGYLKGLWYAFSVGGVRFVMLAGDDVCYQDGAQVYLRGFSAGRQTAWLGQQLAQARQDPDVDWIVVCVHQPAVSTSEFHHGADLGLREEWLPLFDAYGVDLVLCGHEHHYERTHPLRGTVEGSPTLTPRPVPAAAPAVPRSRAESADPAGPAGPAGSAGAGGVLLDTSAGTVHMIVGTGGSSAPSAGRLFDPPACRVVVGTEDPKPGHRHRRPVFAVEDAPWLAARSPEHPYAFAALTVDPGTPGGLTSIQVTLYDSTTPEPVPFDTFALVRPRSDAPARTAAAQPARLMDLS